MRKELCASYYRPEAFGEYWQPSLSVTRKLFCCDMNGANAAFRQAYKSSKKWSDHLLALSAGINLIKIMWPGKAVGSRRTDRGTPVICPGGALIGLHLAFTQTLDCNSVYFILLTDVSQHAIVE